MCGHEPSTSSRRRARTLIPNSATADLTHSARDAGCGSPTNFGLPASVHRHVGGSHFMSSSVSSATITPPVALLRDHTRRSSKSQPSFGPPAIRLEHVRHAMISSMEQRRKPRRRQMHWASENVLAALHPYRVSMFATLLPSMWQHFTAARFLRGRHMAG